MFLLCFGTIAKQDNTRENVYLHLSSSDLLVGESLYFSSYTYSESSGNLSKLSSILYIEILDQKGESVYQTKIQQHDGIGNGSYYLPSDLETGYYHIVAYTRWMQNFNDFYHQTITIINPYKPHNPVSEKPKKIETKFFSEGGQLIGGKENKIVIKSLDQNGDGSLLKGRIVDESGNVISEVLTDQFGFFSFNFIPDPNENYKLIKENKNGFEFINLLEVCTSCVQLRVEKQNDGFEISVQSSTNFIDQLGEVEILRANNIVKHYSLATNSQTFIKYSDLPHGLLKAVFKINGTIQSERLFWNDEIDISVDNNPKIYTTLENVNTFFKITDEANLSISVGKISTKNTLLSMALAHEINSTITIPIAPDFYDSITDERLDNFLITAQLKSSNAKIDSIPYLPEYRYGIVQGKIINKQSRTPLKDVRVAIGFTSANYQVSVATTNNNGDFILRYDPDLIREEGFVNIIDEDFPIEYEIILHSEFYNSYPEFSIKQLNFDSLKMSQVIRRSIINQIENAYYIPEDKDSTNLPIHPLTDMRTYKLDDYTRFATMRDTFIELIYEVGVSKNENKYHFNMKIFDVNNNDKYNSPTLILLDGVMISSEKAMKISPYVIDRIDVLNKNYYFGNIMFDGIIALHSSKNDLANTPPLGNKVELVHVQKDKSRNVGAFNPNKNHRTPHYEPLIYWNPMIKHKGGQIDLSFYTSEVTGVFEIRVEGVTKSGKPISKRKYIEVK